MIITFCNIFAINCFADESDPTSSATEIVTSSDEISTYSIEATEITTEETTEIFQNDSKSDVFYFRLIVVLLLIVMFLIIVNKLF